MLATTDNLARSYNVTPFEIMAQDCDEVILFINYLLRKADNAPAPSAAAPNKQQYIKVDDRTATGGWW